MYGKNEIGQMEENRGYWGQLLMAELTLMHIMILVGMVQKLKGIVHPKRCGSITICSKKK